MALQSATSDYRYTDHCKVCGRVLGSWAKDVPEEKKLCWDHSKHLLNKLTQERMYK